MPNKAKTFFESEVERLYDMSSKRDKKYAQLRSSKAFMDSFYSEKVEVNDLAKAAVMSPFHYIRMFQRIYGLTPRAYLRDLRISKAKEMISSGKSITRTCFDVGYESTSTFSTVFKKCTGLSPRDYQRLNCSNPE